jgi:hypothetical protein
MADTAMNRLGAWLVIAAEPAVVRRALLTSAVVGTVLTLANHGSAILGRGLETETLWPILLTFLTPYLVATISSATAIRSSGAARARHDAS